MQFRKPQSCDQAVEELWEGSSRRLPASAVHEAVSADEFGQAPALLHEGRDAAPCTGGAGMLPLLALTWVVLAHVK